MSRRQRLALRTICIDARRPRFIRAADKFFPRRGYRSSNPDSAVGTRASRISLAAGAASIRAIGDTSDRCDLPAGVPPRPAADGDPIAEFAGRRLLAVLVPPGPMTHLLAVLILAFDLLLSAGKPGGDFADGLIAMIFALPGELAVSVPDRKRPMPLVVALAFERRERAGVPVVRRLPTSAACRCAFRVS
jgi:hypothetical protein